MNSVNVEDILLLIKSTGVDVDVKDLDPTNPLIQQGLDSLDMMNIYFQLEEQFGISIDDESIGSGQWDSVSNIVSGVNEHMKKSF